MNKYLIVGPLLILFGALLPRRRHNRLLPEILVAKVTPHRFRGLDAYLEDRQGLNPGEEFWKASAGLRGVFRRLREMTMLVRILQFEIRGGRVTKEDAMLAWQHAFLQVWFSVWAIPEAVVCRFWTGLPHACGLFALRSHWDLSVWTLTLCGTRDSHKSIILLSELL